MHHVTGTDVRGQSTLYSVLLVHGVLGHEGVKSLVNASFVFLFQQEFY